MKITRHKKPQLMVFNFEPWVEIKDYFLVSEIADLEELTALLDALSSTYGSDDGTGKWMFSVERKISESIEILEYHNGKFHVCGNTIPTHTCRADIVFRDREDAIQFKLTYM